MNTAAAKDDLEDDIDDVDEGVDVDLEATDDTVEIDDSDDFEIEIADTVPADKKPRRAEDAVPEVPSDDEIATYSESVQKRIKQLKFEFHEANRHKEAAIRAREEALKFAKLQQEEAARLRDNLSKGQTAVVGQAKARVMMEVEQAKRDYKNAYEAGDSDALLDAQSRMIKSSNELTRLESWKPQPQPQQAPQRAPQQQAPQQQAPDALKEAEQRVSPQAKAWAERNPWFEQDNEMRALAFGIHENAIRSGIAPDSKAYYDAIDSGMRRRFPEYFEKAEGEVVSAPKKKMAPVVASAQRSGKITPKVRLTSEQADTARRLGVSLKDYAAQLLKDMRENG